MKKNKFEIRCDTFKNHTFDNISEMSEMAMTNMMDSSIIPQLCNKFIDEYDKNTNAYITKVLLGMNIDKDILANQTQEILRLNKVLGEYKALEEQGLLLRLPCKVGDKYYRISKTCSIGGEVEKGKFFPTLLVCEYCCGIEKPCDKEYIIDEYTFENIDQVLIRQKYIGSEVFLTREEAEAKLKELEGKE